VGRDDVAAVRLADPVAAGRLRAPQLHVKIMTDKICSVKQNVARRDRVCRAGGGEFRVDGVVIRPGCGLDGYRRRVGYTPQGPRWAGGRPVSNYMDYMAQAFGMGRREGLAAREAAPGASPAPRWWALPDYFPYEPVSWVVTLAVFGLAAGLPHNRSARC
jgi:hypothetical protein